LKLPQGCQAEIEATEVAGAAVTVEFTTVVEEAEEEETVEDFEADEAQDEAKGLRLRFSRQPSFSTSIISD